MIYVGRNGYHYNGIFGALETFMTWFVFSFMIFYLFFSLGWFFQWLRDAPHIISLSVILFLPICLAVTFLAAYHLGIPLLRLILEQNIQEELLPTCIRTAVYGGLLIYKESFFDKNNMGYMLDRDPKSNYLACIVLSVIIGIVSCFVMLGIAAVIVIVPIISILNFFGDIWNDIFN